MKSDPIRSLRKTEIDAFSRIVWNTYHTQGRHELPWRTTTNPYHIAVSEIMLQQTQVPRVLPKYRLFINEFPTTNSLAQAPLGDVLRAWQGLGYNRRAKMLWHCAQMIEVEHSSKWPRIQSQLEQLPGIGPYTAGAITAFAYGEPVVIIETNIRTVYLHHFFKDNENVTDREILNLVRQTLPVENTRAWYWALMDYGALLKQQYKGINKKSRHYVKQSTFSGSDRQIRGAIIRLLSKHANCSIRVICQDLPYSPERIKTQIQALLAEGLIVKCGKSRYSLP